MKSQRTRIKMRLSSSLQAVFLACITITTLPRNSHGFSVQLSKIPEEVIQLQLNQLKNFQVKEAFDYNSENNQAITGPWKTFAVCLADPHFRPLLGHSESTVLMTVAHEQGDYVCCLVKIVPGSDPLPQDLATVVKKGRELELIENGIEMDTNDVDEEDEDEDGDVEEGILATITSTQQSQNTPCFLYWFEVAKQYLDDDDDNNYYYLVDSLVPDAEDMELDYMETTLFAIGDEDDDDEEDDDDGDMSGYFFDTGL